MSDTIHTTLHLTIGALLFGAVSVLAPDALPARLVGLVLLATGYFGVLNALGLDRPLNRLSAVSAGLGASAYVGWLCLDPAQPRLGLFAVVALLAAILVTGIAALHRDGLVKRLGALGVVSAGLPLAAVVIGHLILGGYGLFGLAWGQAAASGSRLTTWPADVLIAIIAGLTGLSWRRISAELG